MALETLERRAMLAIDATFVGGVLTINYNQPDAGGLVTTTNQNAVIEIDEIDTAPAQTVRVNLYRSSNPNADVYLGVTEIIVNVPTPDALGVSNNSLTIKGLESPEDRIVMVGSGRTVAGRWYDQLPPPDQNQILFEITGIDNLTLTSGGTINVSGSFTNDTADASITVIGTSLETDANRTPFPGQHTGTIVLGENTPEQTPDFPAARLVSNYIHVIGAAIEINSDIYAEGEVSIKASEFTGAPSNLLLPYDITVDANPNGTPGRLDLFAAKSVIQQSTSTIRASLVNVVADNTQNAFGAAVIDLSSHKNDFDELTISTGTALAASTGSVAIRDCDDLVIASNGLLSTTGLMTVHTAGLLTIDTPIFAGGLKAYSDFGILSTDRGSLTIGNGGIDLAAKTVAANATGDITLNGRVEIGDFDLPAVIINNAIRADGQVTIAGGFFAPQAGVTMVEGIEGILIASPVQVGNTFLNENSTAYEITDADLTLVSSNGFIDILDFSGNSAIPQAVQVTNMLSLDAFGDILIDGLVFAGTRYGNPLALVETDALPNIAIRGQGEVVVGSNGALRTSSYETDRDLTTNPLVGRISIQDASFLGNDGVIDADGSVSISIKGDAYLYGVTTARANIDVLTVLGGIDLQGPVRATGGIYDVPEGIAAPVPRSADITLRAPGGGIVTSNLGTIRAGEITIVPGGEDPATTQYGAVLLEAQQGITIGAAIDTPGEVTVSSLLGEIDIISLVRSAGDDPLSDSKIVLEAGNGIYQSDSDLSRIVTRDLRVLNSGAAGGTSHIDLTANNNAISGISGRNLAEDGNIVVMSDSAVTILDVLESRSGSISLAGTSDVVVNASVLAANGQIDLIAVGGLSQSGTSGLTAINVLAGGTGYANGATVQIAPPAAGGTAATAVAVVADGVVTGITLVNPGSGYAAGESPIVVIAGGDDEQGTATGSGAAAVALGPGASQIVVAESDITVSAGSGVTLSSLVRSDRGTIVITAINGDLNLGAGSLLLDAVTGDIRLSANTGLIDLQRATAGGSIEISGNQGVVNQTAVTAETGYARISSDEGSVDVRDVLAAADLDVNGFGPVTLSGDIVSTQGTVRATSLEAAVNLAANVHARQGGISLAAHQAVRQSSDSGVTSVAVISGGTGYLGGATITIAPPAGGGQAATAIANTKAIFDDAGNLEDVFISSITITSPGAGYALGETPVVQISGVDGGEGASASAVGPLSVQSLVARGDILIGGGTDVLLLNNVHSEQGRIDVRSKLGSVTLGVGSAVIRTDVGGISVVADSGKASVGRLISGGDAAITAVADVTLQQDVLTGGSTSVVSRQGAATINDILSENAISVTALLEVTANGELTANTGDISLTSQSGGVSLAANIHARDESIAVKAHAAVFQQGIGVTTIRVTEQGANYTTASVTIAPPAGGGIAATARAVVVPVQRPGLGTTGVVGDIEIVFPGSGYAAGEIVEVTIEGDGQGAQAAAVAGSVLRQLIAGENVTINAGNDVTLSTVVRANKGTVSISSVDGNLILGAADFLAHAPEGGISMESLAGAATLRQLTAARDIDVTTLLDVTFLDHVDSAVGDITVRTTSGNLQVRDRMHAVAGSISLTALDGTATTSPDGAAGISSLQAGTDITISIEGIDPVTSFSAGVSTLVAGGSLAVTTLGSMLVEGQQTARTGDIDFLSRSGAIDLSYSDIHAIEGAIRITAHGEIRQASSDGVWDIVVVNRGAQGSVDAPDGVAVDIAAPQAGGEAASATAVVRQIGIQRENGERIIVPDIGVIQPLPNDIPVWGVTGIVITNRGSGYGAGESPTVTITGLPGATAVALGPDGVPFNIVADDDIDVLAGETVLLTSIVRSNTADVSITSIDRDVDLSDAGQLVHALVGDVAITALAGGVLYNDIVAGGDLSLQSFKALAINRPLVLNGGGVTLASAGEDIDLQANVLAVDQLSLSAKTGIAQTAGTIKATDLYAENSTPTAITLGAAGNDVDRFSAFNIGAITYNDANSFRVGLRTSGPMGVEVFGSAVTLSAAESISVVAGIQAGALQLSAGTPQRIGSVNFVTTDPIDNPGSFFSGTFRDMIDLRNRNSGLAVQLLTFGEPGYSVSEISVVENLPEIQRTVTVLGGTADGGRLGVRGSAGVATGVWFGEGSTGSSLNDVALYGFSSGSAVVIESGDNTVNDLWFGLRADGTAGPANRVGVNVSGDRAYNNVIGSRFVFDPLSANRFAGHTDAAIVVQRGASNNLVAGNLVGGDGLAANRNGIRIDGGSGNRIGTPDQVTPDLRPTESNRIVGNSHYGIEIRNVRGSTTRVENNLVAGNATKVGSGTHGIGVLNSAFVQIGGVSELSRNQVYGSLGGSGIHLSGSNNIRIQGNVIGTDGYHLSANGHTNDHDANRPDLGNGMHGIHVFGRSRDVEIDSNRIVDNERSGVAIASGSSGVLLTNNEIGVWVHPVTGNVHAAGNDADGVTITAANGNTIGAGNLIGYNGGSGIMVENSVAAGLATGNRLAGAELFGNLGHGIHVSGSSRQTVGGYSGEGNVIKENGLDGIRLENDPRIRASAAPHGNVVAGNFVGTNDNQEIDRNWGNRNGIAVMNGVDNVLAGNVVMNNRASGIEIGGGDGNTVGGQIRSAGNFVGYNFGDGVYIHDQASTQLQVGVIGTTITNQGAGYAASRTSVIFTAPAASGGVPARGVAIVSASGQVTGIRLTSSGSGYVVGEPVSVTIFDPQASVIATASVTLGEAARRPDGAAAVSEVSRRHVVSGNEIEANNGAGIYVRGDRTTEIQLGQDLNGRAGRGLGNKISFHDVGILVDAAGRTSLQGNELGDNGMPIDLINGANQRGRTGPVQVVGLASTAWGRSQTRVTGTIVNGGAFHEFWVDVYATPHYDLDDDFNGDTFGHEMRTFLGRTLVTTDANGRASINLVVSESVGLGDAISLTLTSNRHEDGSTVGVWHSTRRHGIDLSAAPTTGSPTVTPTRPGGSSGGASTPGRAPVAPRG